MGHISFKIPSVISLHALTILGFLQQLCAIGQLIHSSLSLKSPFFTNSNLQPTETGTNRKWSILFRSIQHKPILVARSYPDNLILFLYVEDNTIRIRLLIIFYLRTTKCCTLYR